MGSPGGCARCGERIGMHLSLMDRYGSEVLVCRTATFAVGPAVVTRNG